MRQLLREVAGLLRGEPGKAGRAMGPLRLVGFVLLCGSLYGAVMGSFGGFAGERAWQVLISAAKVPLLLLLTLAISLPSFFVFNTLFGVRSDFPAVLRALLGSQTGLTVVLASLAPYTALWYLSSADCHVALLFNGAMFALATLCLASGLHAQTVSLQGTVLSVSGAPIPNATCQLKNLSNKAVTNSQGQYSFSATSALRKVDGYALTAVARGNGLALKVERAGQVKIAIFGLNGQRIRTLVDAKLQPGNYELSLRMPENASQLFLLEVSLNGEVAWHKFTREQGITSVTPPAPAGLAGATLALEKTAAAVDSLYCTSPDYDGGLAKINGRAISSYAGTQNFRMFSLDPAWKAQCAPPMTFNFDTSPGVARYKQLVPNWVATEQEVLTEVCQATFKKATQPTKYASYIANIKTGAGGQVAATGGNTLGFSTEYIAGQPNSYAGWWEVVGVQTHEAVHSYQAYYNTTGDDGFGEAMPDAVRALNGFFSWPPGTKCSGPYTAVYQDGGKYWYFIEMKHPGFLTSIWQMPTGDITTRVQTITGESLTSLATECQTKGMP